MNSVLVPPAGVLDGELREPLLRFVQAAFALAARDLANGGEVPFVLDAHEGRESALYSYRPLYGAFLDERRSLILALPDARRALALLEATPGAVEYARLHVGDEVDDREALRAAVMWPLAVQIAEREDGFECPEEAFDAIFAPLDRGVAGSRHLYDAMAPLVGVLVSEPPVDLGRGVSLVRADVGDIAAGWPESSLLVPPGFGGEPDRRCALAVTLELDPGERPPRLAGLVEDAVRALRLVSGAAIATGPVGFERIDGGPAPARRADLRGLASRPGRALSLRSPPARGRPRDRAAHRRAGCARPAPRGARAVRARAGARGAACAPTPCATCSESRCTRSARSRSRPCAPARWSAATPASASACAISSPAMSSTTQALAAAARHLLLALVLDEQESDALASSADQVLLGARPRPNLVPAGIADLPRS